METLDRTKSVEIKDFLLWQRLLSEIKHTRSTTCFKQLVSLLTRDNFSLQSILGSFVYLQDLQVISVRTPVADTMGYLLKLQFSKQLESVNYPNFLKFMLRQKHPGEPLWRDLPVLPLDSKLGKLNNFLFDSLALYLQQLSFGMEVNLNALANAPTLTQGLLEMITLNP